MDWAKTTAVSTKFVGPWPQAGNKGGGLANEAFAGPAGLAIICANYIISYCWILQLTCRICNFNIYAGPQVCMALVDTATAWRDKKSVSVGIWSYIIGLTINTALFCPSGTDQTNMALKFETQNLRKKSETQNQTKNI